MPKILLDLNNIDQEVVDLIYDKQFEFTKRDKKKKSERKKGEREKVSLEKTINLLLKEAYCSKPVTVTDGK